MRGWVDAKDTVPEVVAFPVVPSRYWLIRPEPGHPEFYRGALIHDEWAETLDRTYTEAGPLHLVLAALKDHRWRQGLPIIVEVPA